MKSWNANPILPISSMKIIQGWIFTAKEKTAAVSFCDSPYHLSVNVEACKLINWHPEALAVALAINVFPHPGGPYNNTPERKGRKILFLDSTWKNFSLLKALYFTLVLPSQGNFQSIVTIQGQMVMTNVVIICLQMASAYLTFCQRLTLSTTGEKKKRKTKTQHKPLGGWKSLDPVNRWRFWKGKITVSCSSLITSSRPAISLHVT